MFLKPILTFILCTNFNFSWSRKKINAQNNSTIMPWARVFWLNILRATCTLLAQVSQKVLAEKSAQLLMTPVDNSVEDEDEDDEDDDFDRGNSSKV